MKNIALETHKRLGIDKTFIGSYECMRLKDEYHFDIVRFIEKAIIESMPDIVITHHPTDLHNDHKVVSCCCQEAVRLPQRMIGYSKPIQKFLFMEVKSSTDWALNEGMNKFSPNYYISVTKEDIEKKIELTEMYKDVIRMHPHSRSRESIHALALYRGSEIGFEYAESFQLVFGGV